MTLNDYSMILFGTTVFLYLSAYLALFHNPSILKFATMILAWIINSVAFVWYGIKTDQIGFICIVAIEVLLIFFVYIITGRIMKDDHN